MINSKKAVEYANFSDEIAENLFKNVHSEDTNYISVDDEDSEAFVMYAYSDLDTFRVFSANCFISEV